MNRKQPHTTVDVEMPLIAVAHGAAQCTVTVPRFSPIGGFPESLIFISALVGFDSVVPLVEMFIFTYNRQLHSIHEVREPTIPLRR